MRLKANRIKGLKKKFIFFINTCLGFLKYTIFTTSIRIAGTIRGFRTLKFAQKDGLLAAFFELFLWNKPEKQLKKGVFNPKKSVKKRL